MLVYTMVILLVIILVLLICWSAGLTFMLLRLVNHYNTLTEGTDRKTLSVVLDQVMKEQHLAKKDIAELMKRCDTMEKENLSHIQRIGLLRFNPFKDTGGDQSFIISLVDATDTGILVSGLYSRSGTRWYAKKIYNGKGVDYELSDDEKKAVHLARTNS